MDIIGNIVHRLRIRFKNQKEDHPRLFLLLQKKMD